MLSSGQSIALCPRISSGISKLVSELIDKKAVNPSLSTMVFVRFGLVMALSLSLTFWGPAAFAEDDVPTPEEIENTADPGGLPSTDSDSPEAVVKPAQKKMKKAKRAAPAKKPPVKSKPSAKTQPSRSQPAAQATAKATSKVNAISERKDPSKSADEDDELVEAEESAAIKAEQPEDLDPVQVRANARELSIRTMGLAKLAVLKSARRYVPQGLESRLSERLIQDLTAKTYFEPRPVDGPLSQASRSTVIQQAAKKNQIEGLLVLEIGLEEILGTLFTANGLPIKNFQVRYLVGELEEKNAVSLLSERIVEGIVQATPYRGFVTSVGKGSATINLGSNHQIKEGDVLELFEFRRPNLNSTRRLIGEVVVQKVNGPTESVVGPISGRRFVAEPFAKVSFRVSKVMATEATDHSIVSGRWWIGVGGQLQSLGAEAAAPKYESRLFKVNSTPFGSMAAGNDVWTFNGAFGSASSSSETLNFFDFQGLYSVYQLGGAQSAWNFSAGGRIFLINVVPLPNQLSALSSTTILSPVVEARYNYVPKGRVRLGFHSEIFWPVYTTGADLGALIFAFGAGAGVQLQLAVTSQLGVEVSGKLRYIRRPIDGQSGVQERQSILGAGLVFSF